MYKLKIQQNTKCTHNIVPTWARVVTWLLWTVKTTLNQQNVRVAQRPHNIEADGLSTILLLSFRKKRLYTNISIHTTTIVYNISSFTSRGLLGAKAIYRANFINEDSTNFDYSTSFKFLPYLIIVLKQFSKIKPIKRN